MRPPSGTGPIGRRGPGKPRELSWRGHARPFFRQITCPRSCQWRAVCSRGPPGPRGLALPPLPPAGALRTIRMGVRCHPDTHRPTRAEQTNAPGASVDRFCCGRLGWRPGRWPASSACGSMAVGMAPGWGVRGWPGGAPFVRAARQPPSYTHGVTDTAAANRSDRGTCPPMEGPGYHDLFPFGVKVRRSVHSAASTDDRAAPTGRWQTMECAATFRTKHMPGTDRGTQVPP